MTTVDEFVAWCVTQIGTTEGPGKNETKYAAMAGHVNNEPWCATFLVAGARTVGLELPSYSAYTPTMANAFRAVNRWYGEPQVGDFAFFDFPDTVRRIQHVGVVESIRPGVLRTIEGNTSPGTAGSQSDGGGVYRRSRDMAHVVGFGRPYYEEDAMNAEQAQALQKVLTNTDNLARALQEVDKRLARVEQAVAVPAGSDTVALTTALKPLIDLAQRLEA